MEEADNSRAREAAKLELTSASAVAHVQALNATCEAIVRQIDEHKREYDVSATASQTCRLLLSNLTRTFVWSLTPRIPSRPRQRALSPVTQRQQGQAGKKPTPASSKKLTAFVFNNGL